MIHPYNVIDLVSILPYYILIGIDHFGSDVTNTNVFRVLRLFRVFRIMKLGTRWVALHPGRDNSST